MAKGAVRKKNKALLLALKAEPAKDAGGEPLHGEQPPDVQCAKALIEAVEKEDPHEVLACMRSLFKHFESEPHEEAGEASDET